MAAEHTSKQYDIDLEAIRSKVLKMGGMVESQFIDALECFRTGNADKADAVIRGDEAVNRLEVALDDDCSHLIVRRQPAANDLRMVMATIKVITDLERIGDEATKIARSGKSISSRVTSDLQHYNVVRLIAAEAQSMLHSALDCFARLDQEQAGNLIYQDERVDREFKTVLRTLITFMMEDPRTISLALDTLWVAKAIERIGDHAKNIAEYVIYVVGGLDIRHSGPPAAQRSME